MSVSPTKLRQRYSFADFLYYTCLAAVPFFTAWYAIFQKSTAWMVFYLALLLASIVLIYRHYCSHCPHYTRENKTTQCLFFWGMPKVFQQRPGPLGFMDKVITLTASAAVIVFPLYWLFQQTGLLIIFLLSLILLVATIRRDECGRCVFYDCPANKVPEDLKTQRETGKND
jgi:hypothetical protein